MNDQLTNDDRTTIRDAVLGALALVTKAEPGFFATFKESSAGSKALAQAPAEVRDLFAGQGMPHPPTGRSMEEITSKVLQNVEQAAALLAQKAPEQLEGFRTVVLQACQAVAEAAKGVSPEETATIQQIRTSLSSQPAAPVDSQAPQDDTL